MRFELNCDSGESVTILHETGYVYIFVDSYNQPGCILVSKEEALQLAAALVSAAKEVEGE